MAPGEYTVILKWKNMLMSKQSIVVQSNKVTPGLNFTLKEISGYISGRIISKSNNEPIENAIIIASSKLSGNYAISDKKGNYKIYGLSPGTYELMVSAQKFENNSKSKLLLENEHVLENIDFYLTNR